MLRLMRAYSPVVSIRKLLALFVAVAVLFAPALTRAGSAFAAIPDHQMQMMEGGHCASPPAIAGSPGSPTHSTGEHKSSGHGKATSCCISMCMAVAVSAPAAAAVEPIHNAGATFALVNQYHGRITEIATPPPRLA